MNNQIKQEEKNLSALKEILLTPSNSMISNRFSKENQAAECMPGKCNGVCKGG